MIHACTLHTTLSFHTTCIMVTDALTPIEKGVKNSMKWENIFVYIRPIRNVIFTQITMPLTNYGKTNTHTSLHLGQGTLSFYLFFPVEEEQCPGYLCMTTLMLCVASNPSSWFNSASSGIVHCTSLSPKINVQPTMLDSSGDFTTAMPTTPMNNNNSMCDKNTATLRATCLPFVCGHFIQIFVRSNPESGQTSFAK